MNHRAVAAVLGLSLVSTGCVQVAPPGGHVSGLGDEPIQGGLPSVVVAILDTGVNPYHQLFRDLGRRPPPETIPGLTGIETARISFDIPYDQAVKADDWDRLENRKLYWFEGTKIIGISFGQWGGNFDPPVLGKLDEEGRFPILDESGHGTQTAGSVAMVNPDAWIVAVEIGEENETEAFNWVANQDWIDIASYSYGAIANAPFIDLIDDETSDPTRRVVESGKLVFTAAGNEANPCVFEQSCGPPWVISVGGVDTETRGEGVMSAKLPDFVSDWRLQLPTWNSIDGYAENGGTSFAAPTAAGVASKVILSVRRELNWSGPSMNGVFAADARGVINVARVREALNLTAAFWEPTDYKGTKVYPEKTLYNVFIASAPIIPGQSGVPLGPWVQMGWGYLGNETVEKATAVLLGRAEPPSKTDAQVFMQSAYALRQAYWTSH